MAIIPAINLDELKYAKQDAFLAARMGMDLVKAYPGHGWEVEADSAQGICKIFNRHMSPQVGYVLRMQEINFATLSKDMIKIGGELLERFGLSRTRFEADKIRQIQADTHGRAKADLS